MLPENLEVWEPAGEQANDIDQVTIETVVQDLDGFGQHAVVTARELRGGKIQVVAKAYLVRAIRLANELKPDPLRKVEVRVFATMSDEDAYRVLGQDVEQGPQPSSLARGQFMDSAVKHFGSEADAARGLRIAKSTISKNLDVVRCLPHVGEKVEVHRDISQRDAIWLMQIVRRADDGAGAADPDMQLVRDAIKTMKVMPAKKVFAGLRAALKATEPKKPRKNVVPIINGAGEIGTVKKLRDGRVTIELIRAGDIPLQDLMSLVEGAIAQTRQ